MLDISSRLQSLLDGGKNERCGFILDDGEIVEVTNIAEHPSRAFVMNPAEVVQFCDRAIATWHTHPDTDSNLSESDYAGFLNWPSLDHYIIGYDGVSRFVVEDGFVLNA